ncbi:MAG TPA: acyl-CoA dehydrogenase, partial [Acidimicrobiia bacterium]|nr:acyl-CoA dehydrogenase [Acidimicrobiia bacterium]
MITKDEFRAEATAFLEANAKRRVKASQGWGEGSDEVGILPERTPEEDAALLAEGKVWRAKVFDAGFG